MELPAYDIDGDELHVEIGYLATDVVLALTVDPTVLLSPASVVPKDTKTGNYTIYYLVLSDFRGKEKDSFSYYVSDAEFTTQEQYVHLVLEEAGIDADLPASGESGYALSFEFTNQTATLGSIDDIFVQDTSEYAVSMWIKTSASVPTGLSSPILTAGPMMIFLEAGSVGISVDTEGSTLQSTHQVNDGNWHFFIVYFREDAVITLVVDGAPQITAHLENFTLRDFGGDTVSLGGFESMIDEFVISQGLSIEALHEQYIQRKPLAELAVPADDIILYLRFNVIDGNMLYVSMGSSTLHPILGASCKVNTSPSYVPSTLGLNGSPQVVPPNEVSSLSFELDTSENRFLIVEGPKHGTLLNN